MFEKWIGMVIRQTGPGEGEQFDGERVRQMQAEIDRLKSPAPTQDGRVAAEDLWMKALETIRDLKWLCFTCDKKFKEDEIYGDDDGESHATCPHCGSEDVSAEADEIAVHALKNGALPATVNEGEAKS